MTENEFLLALRGELEPIRQELRETRNDLRDLKLEVQTFKADYQSFKADYQSFKAEMMDFKADYQSFKVEMMDFKADYQNFKLDMLDFKTYVEIEIEGKIKLLAENYVPAAKRYERAMPEINEIKRDIDILKSVVRKHSEQLEKIS